MEFNIELLKEVPSSIKLTFIYIAIIIYMIERIYSLISKGYQTSIERRKENGKEIESLVSDDPILKKLNEEIKQGNAFYQLSGLRVNKERRAILLDLFDKGYISELHFKKINPFLSKTDDGFFELQLGLTEFWSAITGFIFIYLIGIAMLTANFVNAAKKGDMMPILLLIGTALTFFIAYMTRGDVAKIKTVIEVAKKLKKDGLLIGSDQLIGQFISAYHIRKKPFIYSCALIAFSLIISYLMSLAFL